MTGAKYQNSGRAPIPLPLKILAGLVLLWAIGSVMNMNALMTNGVPVFGKLVSGWQALFLPHLLDIIGPAIFLFALWTRKSWGAKWGYFYIGVFILNGLITLLTLRSEFGLGQIIAPNVVALVFVSVIYWKRSYFEPTDAAE